MPYFKSDVTSESSKKLFTVISTFAGGGGSSTGYRLAGGNVLAINEFVEEAIKTYSLNFPDTKIIPGDIKKLSGKDFLDVSGLKEGELDIFDGSPPCSAFSVSSSSKGKNWKGAILDTRKSYFDDDGEMIHEGSIEVHSGIKSYSDGKTVEAIEDLFNEFIRVAKDIKPKVIIAENVKGLTMDTARAKLAEFINGFEKIGYLTTYKVLNAAEYGVAQSRQRTFFVCVRDDVANSIGLNILNVNSVVFPNPSTPKEHGKYSKEVAIEKAIGDIVNDPQEVKELLDVVENGFLKKFVALLPKNPPKVLQPKETCFNLKRPARHLPCPTLTQTGQQKGASGVIHYNEDRKLTIKELKRIMSLPDDYELTGTFDQQAERIGRMVAPKMMFALANHVYKNILKPYKDIS
jgi:DNA (cytosine-5)-methyltransferase 1